MDLVCNMQEDVADNAAVHGQEGGRVPDIVHAGGDFLVTQRVIDLDGQDVIRSAEVDVAGDIQADRAYAVFMQPNIGAVDIETAGLAYVFELKENLSPA